MRFHGEYLRRDFAAYGGGGKGGGTTQVTNQTQIPPWISEAGQSNYNFATDISNRPYAAYPGQTVAGMTPDQGAAYDWVRNNYTNAGTAITDARNSITGGNLVTSANNLLNPYLSAVENSAVGQVQRQGQLAQNDLAAKAASAGAFGGTRFGVQSGILSADTARAAGDISNTIRGQGWDKAISSALTQAGQVGQMAAAGQTAGLQGASALAVGGAAQQQQNQQDINALIQNWQQARDYPLEQLAIRQSGLTSTPYSTTTTSSQPYQGQSGLQTAGTAIQTAASLAALVGML
jgi:hypothetical protein